MIISFRFKNFRSFRDETFINMNAVGYKEHPHHLIKIANNKLIKTLSIYGSNASGKSNLFMAFCTFHSIICGQFFSLKAAEDNPLLTMMYLTSMNRIAPFHTNSSEIYPTEMELSFVSEGRVYEYGFTACNEKVLSEHLTTNNHVVFTRDDSKITIGRHFEKYLRTKLNLQPNDDQLFCSVLSIFNNPEITVIMKPFINFFRDKIFYHFDFLEPFQLLGSRFNQNVLNKFLGHREELEFSFSQMRKLGIPIVDIAMEDGALKLGFRIKNRSTNKYQVNYMKMEEVSSGTIKYIYIFMKIYKLSKYGGVLFIDSISSDLHPSVTKFIIDTFQDEKNKNMQLIFITYDVSILNNQQFRRDEVAFVDLNEYLESHIYTLADIKVRSDASFAKDYLLGKYGALPIIRESLS